MEKFDVAVVGAGPAGATAATLLAKAGLEVVLVERGTSPGSKNVSGGLVYSRIYDEVYPGFWQSAPLERAITAHSVVMLDDESAVAVDFHKPAQPGKPANAYSVLRAKFDPWLAQMAEDAGANVITGITVDQLLMQDARVVGIRAGSDDLGADVVVVAEGPRATLLKQASLQSNSAPKDVSLGIKEVVALPEGIITERFQCDASEGRAYTFVGHTGGVEGGGFLYTNRDTLSLGVVVKIESLYKSGRQPHEVLDEFKSHPFVRRLVAGGEVVEYSAQIVHRGGFHLIPRLYGDGYVVAGSAARLLLNNVLTLRGMDVAVASGAAAAKGILAAKEQGDFSAAGLAGYEAGFKSSQVYTEMKTFERVYSLLENKRLFDKYPQVAAAVAEDMFSVSAEPAPKAYASLRRRMQGKLTTVELAKDVLQIVRGLVI